VVAGVGRCWLRPLLDASARARVWECIRRLSGHGRAADRIIAPARPSWNYFTRNGAGDDTGMPRCVEQCSRSAADQYCILRGGRNDAGPGKLAACPHSPQGLSRQRRVVGRFPLLITL